MLCFFNCGKTMPQGLRLRPLRNTPSLRTMCCNWIASVVTARINTNKNK